MSNLFKANKAASGGGNLLIETRRVLSGSGIRETITLTTDEYDKLKSGRLAIVLSSAGEYTSVSTGYAFFEFLIEKTSTGQSKITTVMDSTNYTNCVDDSTRSFIVKRETNINGRYYLIFVSI